jgi:hypothetical protein
MHLGIERDASLGAAEGHVDDGALPRHPRGKGANLVERDVGMIADPPFARAAHHVVQHAIAREGADRAVVHLDGKFDDDRAVRPFEVIDQPALEVGHVGDGAVELLGGDVKRIEVFGGRRRGHRRAFLRMNPSEAPVSLL